MSLPSVLVVVRPGGGWQLLILSLVILTGCNKVEPAKSINQEEVPQDAIQLLFTYGSEKEDWVRTVTADFNQRKFKTAAGRPIFVNALAQGSGECIEQILADTQRLT